MSPEISGQLTSVFRKNLIKGGLNGRNAKGGRTHTRAIKGIDGDVKLNRALWVMAENMLQLALMKDIPCLFIAL